ncbi:MAG: DUF349 domain-containing protein [Bacteroidetes bacterium]|nr:DUF349 domain-containing protein [Bacteroidota bacterium]
METKQQLDQNPESENAQKPEENTDSVISTETKTKRRKKEPVNDKEKKPKKPARKKAQKPEIPELKMGSDATGDSNEVSEQKEIPDDVKPAEIQETTELSGEIRSGQEVAAGAEKEMIEPGRTESADLLPDSDSLKPGEEISEIEIPGVEASVTVDDGEDEEEVEVETEVEGDILKLSRQELVEMMEETVKETDINKIRKKVALIKVAFLKINKDEQHKKYEDVVSAGHEKADLITSGDELENRFNQAFSIYKDNRQVFLEDQEKVKVKNLESKKIILEELKALIESEESLKKTYDEFKALQEKWKEIGMVPKNTVNDLWQSYHFLVEKFFDKVKINKELRDLDLRKNLELKIEICEQTEGLLLETSILKSFKQLQKYHQHWKEIGPVPQDKKDEIWERFKNATDKINQRRREHYEKLEDTFKNNLMAKTALCDKAEEILQVENKSIKDWQNTTDQITELLKVWKTIGPAPRKQNDEIWDRFKTSLDTYFAGKKEFFQKIKEEQLNNYNLKLNLCAQAEAVKSSTDWKRTSQELINLQNEWKAIGPVPRKLSDKIWKRFRAACDEFFNAKSQFYSSIGKTESDNLKLKEDLIKKVEEFAYSDDKNANLEILKGFQREWTEIGHVPIREKERLQNEFRTSINKQLDKLKISKSEIQNINYRNRIEGLRDKPDSERIMSNEKAVLINKRKKIEEEIKLWENNIGFLAASKKASLLKEEFQKKIDNGKQEVEVLNQKIKMLEKELH